MNQVSLKLCVRDARKLSEFLVNTEFSTLAAQIRTQLDDYDQRCHEMERQRKLEKALRKEQEEKKAACKREGHPDLIYDTNVRLIDSLTIGRAIEIPTCVRCNERLVRLADGQLKNWLEWTETKEQLHQTMFQDKLAVEQAPVTQ